MDISGLPGVLIRCAVADVDPLILPLILNFLLIGILAFAVLKFFSVSIPLGFSRRGLAAGLKAHAIPGLLAGLCTLAAFLVGLYPFDARPTVWKILIEGVVYYVGVAVVEEFYVRGLFLHIVEAVCRKSPRKTELAIVVSSVVFGLGHLPGVTGMGAGVAAFKVVSTIGMGLYFGTIYKRTNNFWVPVVLHALIDICALPYCFKTEMFYPAVSIVILLITYVALGAYSLLLMKRTEGPAAQPS